MYNNVEIWQGKSSERNISWCKKCIYIYIWNFNVDNIVISKLVQTKTNSKYLIDYLDKVTSSLVLILPKMSGYVKTFKVKNGDKGKNGKLMSFRINDEKLLEKYKTIWPKIEDLNYRTKCFSSF